MYLCSVLHMIVSRAWLEREAFLASRLGISCGLVWIRMTMTLTMTMLLLLMTMMTMMLRNHWKLLSHPNKMTHCGCSVGSIFASSERVVETRVASEVVRHLLLTGLGEERFRP